MKTELTKQEKAVFEAIVVAENHTKGERREALKELGEEMARFKHELGFPPDMFLDKVKEEFKGIGDGELILIVYDFQAHEIEHRRKSGITDKRLGELRERNNRRLYNFIKTKELGIY